MNTTKYLLAKYIADLHRFEPRNIGVIVWSPLGVEARFLAEHPGRPGEVDGRSLPGFVTSLSAYKQWVRYWRNAVSGETFKPAEGGEPVLVSSAAFMEALQQTNRGNFVIVEGGDLLDEVRGEELELVANQLFTSLVETNAAEEPRDLNLDEVWERLLTTTELKNNPHYHRNYPVQCTVAGTEQEYLFSDAYANGTLERLYQRVSLPKRKLTLQKNVHDTAWRFEKVIEANIIPAEKTGAIVYLTEEQQTQPEVERALRELGSVTKIINLRNEAAAIQEIQQLPLLGGH